MNPSSHTSGPASVGSAYYKTTAPRNTAASQETLLEYLGIKPTPPNTEGYQGVPYMVDESRKLPAQGYGPHYKNNDKILNNGYTTHTPYGTMKDGEYPTDKQHGDIPYVPVEVEIQEQKDQQVHRYDLGVKEEPLDVFASSDNNGYTSATYNPFSSDDNSSSYTSSNSAIYANGVKNGSTVDLLCDTKSGEICPVGPREFGKQRPYCQTDEELRIKRAKRAAAQRENRRRRREQMTMEEVRLYLTSQAAAQRERRERMRAMMTSDELAMVKEKTNAMCRERRARIAAGLHPYYGAQPEELIRRRAAIAAAQRENRRRKREKMTPEELQQYLSSAAQAQKERRNKRLASMTPDELQSYRSMVAARYREQRHAKKHGIMLDKQPRTPRSEADCVVAEAQRLLSHRQDGLIDETMPCSDTLAQFAYMDPRATENSLHHPGVPPIMDQQQQQQLQQPQQQQQQPLPESQQQMQQQPLPEPQDDLQSQSDLQPDPQPQDDSQPDPQPQSDPQPQAESEPPLPPPPPPPPAPKRRASNRPQRAAAAAAKRELQRLQESAIEDEQSAQLEDQIAAQNLILQILMHAQRAAAVESSGQPEVPEEEAVDQEKGDGAGVEGTTDQAQEKPKKKKKGPKPKSQRDKEIENKLSHCLEDGGVELLAQLLELKQEKPDFSSPAELAGQFAKQEESVQKAGHESDDEHPQYNEEIMQVQCLLHEEEDGEGYKKQEGEQTTFQSQTTEQKADGEFPAQEPLANRNEGQQRNESKSGSKEQFQRERGSVQDFADMQEDPYQPVNMSRERSNQSMSRSGHGSPSYENQGQKQQQSQVPVQPDPRQYPYPRFPMEEEQLRQYSINRLMEQKSYLPEKMFDRQPYQNIQQRYFVEGDPQAQCFGASLEELQRFHHYQLNQGNLYQYRGKHFYS